MSETCQAWCPPSTYARMRPCSKWRNLRAVKMPGGKVIRLCPHHQLMARECVLQNGKS